MTLSIPKEVADRHPLCSIDYENCLHSNEEVYNIQSYDLGSEPELVAGFARQQAISWTVMAR
jgi:hypothetical protein